MTSDVAWDVARRSEDVRTGELVREFRVTVGTARLVRTLLIRLGRHEPLRPVPGSIDMTGRSIVCLSAFAGLVGCTSILGIDEPLDPTALDAGARGDDAAPLADAGPTANGDGAAANTSDACVSAVCTQGQTSCVSGGVAACTVAADGCGGFGVASACGVRQSCTEDAGTAACVCNPDPVCTAVGTACGDASTLSTCEQDSQGCFYEATSSTCLNGACSAGSCCTNACSNGMVQCGSSTTIQSCQVQANGCAAWVLTRTCPSPSDCESDACTVRYGFPSPLTNTATNFNPGFLFGEEITVSEPITVIKLGANLLTSSGGSAIFALYTNSGGLPSTLVVNTVSAPVVAGLNEIPTAPTPIEAGTYWIMAEYSATVEMNTGASDVDEYVSEPYGTIPSQITTTDSPGNDLPYYVVGTE